MLNPPSKNKNTLDEDELLKELDDIDKQNNNYLKSSSSSNYKSHTKNFEPQYLSTAVASDQNDVQIDNSRRKLTFSADTSSQMNQSRLRTISDLKRDFQLGDIVEFVNRGIEVYLFFLNKQKK